MVPQYLHVGALLGNEGSYTCSVCDDATDQNCRNETTCNPICGEYYFSFLLL